MGSTQSTPRIDILQRQRDHEMALQQRQMEHDERMRRIQADHDAEVQEEQRKLTELQWQRQQEMQEKRDAAQAAQNAELVAFLERQMEQSTMIHERALEQMREQAQLQAEAQQKFLDFMMQQNNARDQMLAAVKTGNPEDLKKVRKQCHEEFCKGIPEFLGSLKSCLPERYAGKRNIAFIGDVSAGKLIQCYFDVSCIDGF